MWIDFSSRPPSPGFTAAAPHLQNYRRVYSASEKHSAGSEAARDLQSYLATYERLGARHVVLKARDVETTFGLKISNETVAAFCAKNGPRY
ncbi:MAG: amidohydrolase, partial [Mesorhizobium sp.]